MKIQTVPKKTKFGFSHVCGVFADAGGMLELDLDRAHSSTTKNNYVINSKQIRQKETEKTDQTKGNRKVTYQAKAKHMMTQIHFLLVILLQTLADSFAGIPAPAQFFSDQLVDHHHQDRRWTQRYYIWEDSFRGPGSPIFLILGGEGAIPPEKGLVYPAVTHFFAPYFGAFVLQPEHRFYGASQPMDREEIQQRAKDEQIDPRIQLLTTEQALMDAIRLLHHIQEQLGCSPLRDDPTYCPVIAVGGSYPGFMSAMARLRFPESIDMAYAASAPMLFYAQKVHPSAYYQHITQVAEKALPGCAHAVQTTLLDVQTFFQSHDFHSNAHFIGICPGTIPNYIQDSSTFLEEVFMMVAYTFANHNMAYYPPSNTTALYQACSTFRNNSSSLRRLQQFLVDSLAGPINECVDMRDQLPTGPHATISGGDWSGDGTGSAAESWDFQTCTLLVEQIGMDSRVSMFPDRAWSLEWLEQHCSRRFKGVTPRPTELYDKWNWLDWNQTSRILFTNGLLDGWSVSGIVSNVSEDILVMNFPNGAHHSDLSGHIPDQKYDTPDILDGLHSIRSILQQWLEDVMQESATSPADTTSGLRGDVKVMSE